MRFCSAITNGFLLVCASTALGAWAQSGATAPAATARDYSFTISTTQPWTDTGVDLEAGDVLEITSSSHSGGCDPRGATGSAPGNASLPLAATGAGALIAKLQEQGTPVLVGSSRQVKADQAGHLFFGVNGPGACSGSFAVKVHATSGGATSAIGNSLTSNSATAASPTSPAAGSAAKPAQDIKSKLASAAQVFLAGQFGSGATPASSATAPTSSNAVSADSAAAAPATSPLNVSSAALDAGLQKDIDSLPRRVNDQFNNQGDMVNFVLVGSAAGSECARGRKLAGRRHRQQRGGS